MAGLVDEARLNMTLLATDEASEVIGKLTDTVAALRDAITQLVDSGTGLTDLTDQFDALASAMGRVGAGAQEASRAVQGVSGAAAEGAAAAADAAGATTGLAAAADQAAGAIEGLQEGIQGVQDLGAAADDAAEGFGSLQDDAQTALAGVAQAGDQAAEQLSQAFGAATEQVRQDLQGLQAGMIMPVGTGAERTSSAIQQMIAAGVNPEAAYGYFGQAPPEATPPGLTWGSTLGSVAGNAQEAIGGMSRSLMFTGINAWMGVMALSMLGRAGMGMADIQSVMQTAHTTPGETERLIGELGVGGVNPQSVPQFLAATSSRLRTLFQPSPQSGMLSKQALMVEALGIGPSIVAETQAQQLQTIANTYGSLVTAGRGGEGGQLLGLLGMSSLQPLMANWGTVRQQFRGFDLGLSAQQIQAQTGQGMSLQVALTKLTITFTALATDLAPLADRIVNALNGIVTAFASDHGSVLAGLAAAFGAMAKQVGDVVTGLAALYLALKVYGTLVTVGKIAAPIAQMIGGAGGAAAGGALEGGAAAAGGLAAAGMGATVLVVVAALVLLVAGLIQEGHALDAAAARTAARVREATGAVGSALTHTADVVTTHGAEVTSSMGRWAADVQTSDTTVVQASRGADLNIGAALREWGHDITAGASTVSGAVAAWAQGAAAWTVTQVQGLDRWAQGAGAAVGAWGAQARAWGTDVVGYLDGLAGSIQDAITAVFGAIAQIQLPSLGGLVSAIEGALQGLFGGVAAWVSQEAQGLLASAKQAIAGIVGSVTQPATSTEPSGTVAPSLMTRYLQQAMQITGAPPSWMPQLEWMIQRESGGQAGVVSSTGVQYGGGHGVEHAVGLMQLMPTTFQEYAQRYGVASLGITNPLANLVAGIGRIQSAWGSPGNIPGVPGGKKAQAAYQGYAEGGILTEAVAGLGLATGQRYLFGEAGPEAVVPLGRPGRGQDTMTLNVTVNAQGSTALTRQLAQEVARELALQLKLRGKFDMSPA